MTPQRTLAGLAALALLACSGEGETETDVADTALDAPDAADVLADVPVDGADVTVDTAPDSADVADTDDATDGEPVDAGTDAAADADAAPDVDFGDPPRLRDVRVTIDGAYPYNLDLNGADRAVALPTPQTAEWVVWASDDTAEDEDIVVEIIDRDGVPLEVDAPRFEGGLYYLSATVSPGQTYAVSVGDGGQATVSNSLDVPDLAHRMVGEWMERHYDAAGEPDAAYPYAFDDDGTFTGQNADGDISGTWSADDSSMTMTYADGTVITSAFAYNDGTHFCLTPYSADAIEGELEANWERTFERTEDDDAVARVTTLTIGDGTYDRVERSDEDVLSERAGTWSIVPNESYTDNFGDILVRTNNELDGEAIDPIVRIDLYRQRESFLCLTPLTRVDD